MTQVQIDVPQCLGWRPDLPDFRDFSSRHECIAGMLACLNDTQVELPSRVDLRSYFRKPLHQPIDSRHALASACTNLFKYFEYRALGRDCSPCPRFLAETASRMNRLRGLGEPGLRDMLYTMHKCGVAPSHCTSATGDTPEWWLDPLLYTFADSYRPLHYFRVDSCDQRDPALILNEIKRWIANGLAIAFGFTFYGPAYTDGLIDFRPTFDEVTGGIAALAVGFDDSRYSSSKGALRVMMPWGSEWGDGGYGWLNYNYVLQGMARDFWTIFKPQWNVNGEFRIAASQSD